MGIQITSVAQFGKNENKAFYKAFYSTFFNLDFKSNVFRKNLKIQTFLAGDSLTNQYNAEIIGKVENELKPVIFKVKIKKVNAVEVKSINESDSLCYFMYLNDFRYSSLLDSIEKGLSDLKENDIEQLLQQDINESSQSHANRISLVFKNTSDSNVIYYIKSAKITGKVQVSLRRRDIKFMRQYDYSIEEWKRIITFRFIENSYIYDEDLGIAFNLFELADN